MNKRDVTFYHTTRLAGNEVVGYTAVSNFNTVGVDLTEFRGAWSIQIFRSLSDGTPNVTIECSDDNTNWGEYKALAIEVDIPNIIIDDEFIPRYLRLKYTANSATGTVTFKMNLNDWFKK